MNKEDFVYNPDELKENPYSELFLAGMQKWLRTKGIHIEIVYEIGYKDNQHCDTWRAIIDKMSLDETEKLEEIFDSYEQALCAGISRALQILTR